MPSAAPSVKLRPWERPTNPIAAVLSYLIPGLGQIYQGRIAKGVLFFVCVYALFFIGIYLGSGTVGIKTTLRERRHLYGDEQRLSAGHRRQKQSVRSAAAGANLYNRPQFAGQFWVGIAAWPAVWQYLNYDERQEKGDPLLGISSARRAKPPSTPCTPAATNSWSWAGSSR